MRASFVHTADNHLGYEQYGVKERYNDFALAFQAVVDDAIKRRADFFVIAGDLFNKRAIDALTLIQAQEALQRLQAAGIPAIAIEGNHDRSYYRDGISWLQFLGWQGTLCLLNPLVRDGVPVLTPWDQQAMRGAYVDLCGGALRVYGLPWYGAATARVMEQFAGELGRMRAEEEAAGVQYRVLLLHTGVEGMLPQLHGLPTRQQFEPLRELVDYVALGHVHKPYEIENWLYNPGSTETWGAEEAAWDRGYYYVEVDTDSLEPPRHHARHIVNPRRPFHRLIFRVDGVPEPTALYARFDHFCQRQALEHLPPSGRASPPAPVVDVTLTGILGFDTSALERAQLEECVERHFHPLVVRIHDTTRETEFDPDTEADGDGRDRTTWHQLELRIFQDLIGRDARYLPEAGRWATTLAELKQMALDGEEPAAIATKLRDARDRLMRH
ncbi:MAG TPA: exonuclease SbcCD subunit D [Ktedonobacterales bacterium]|nr:exonuclease SbcCD subunit D [Ktedonobacterales bacterium]